MTAALLNEMSKYDVDSDHYPLQLSWSMQLSVHTALPFFPPISHVLLSNLMQTQTSEFQVKAAQRQNPCDISTQCYDLTRAFATSIALLAH